jgi:hypothetical protein
VSQNVAPGQEGKLFIDPRHPAAAAGGHNNRANHIVNASCRDA